MPTIQILSQDKIDKVHIEMKEAKMRGAIGCLIPDSSERCIEEVKVIKISALNQPRRGEEQARQRLIDRVSFLFTTYLTFIKKEKDSSDAEIAAEFAKLSGIPRLTIISIAGKEIYSNRVSSTEENKSQSAPGDAKGLLVKSGCFKEKSKEQSEVKKDCDKDHVKAPGGPG